MVRGVEAGRKESGRELARGREHSVHDNAFPSNEIRSYRSRMPLEYVEDRDAEWRYDFSDERVRLGRGCLRRCMWSLRSEICTKVPTAGEANTSHGSGMGGLIDDHGDR